MNNEYLELIGRFFPLTERPATDLNTFKVNGMNFETRAFTAEGLGNVALMEASGMLGMMKMTTLVLNPFSVNAPLLSYDRIQAMGKDKLYAETFDTMLKEGEGIEPGAAAFETAGLEAVSGKYAALPDFDAGEHWYDGLYVVKPLFKEGKKKDAEAFDGCFRDFLEAYLKACAAAPKCDEALKKEKAAVYSEGLLSKGGPATDPVKHAIGEEKTAAFFRNVLFGTAND